MGLLLSRFTPSSYSVTFSYSVTDESLIGLDIQDLTVIGADIDSVSISSNINWTTQSSSHSSSLINFSSVYFNGISIDDTVEVTFNIDLLEPVKTVFFYFGNTRINDSVTLDQALTGCIGESLPSGSDVLDISVLSFTPTQLSGTHSSSFSLDSQDSQLSIDTSVASEAISEFDFVATDSNNNVLNLNIINIDGNDAPVSSQVSLSAIAEDSGGYTITTSALLANASDIDGDTLSVRALAISSGLGTLDDNGDGSWVYTPATDDNSGVSFSYTITDDGLTDGVADNLSIVGTAVLESTSVSGIAYHWNTHALMASVEVNLANMTGGAANGVSQEATSDAAGLYAFSQKQRGTNHMTASKDITAGEMGSVISSADALAALKIAVGINPNTDPDRAGPEEALPVSPYQFIAADINGDGRVTSADALEILKIAVKLPTAEPRRWVFVAEDYDFWDEASGSFKTTRTDVTWDSEGIIFEDPEKSVQNIVGVLLGDVNGNWSAPEGSGAIADSHLAGLVEQGGPLEGSSLAQWGVSVSSEADNTTDTSTANVFGFSGFGAIDERQAIMAGQEAVVTRFTSSGDSHKAVEEPLTGVVSGDQVLADRTITFDSVLVDNSSITFTPEDNLIVWLDGLLSYSRTSRAINAQDALEVFRLALNQSTTSGSKSAADYISADFDRNGSVSTTDALEILNYALRRPNFDAEWIFVDTEADLDGIGRRSSSYDTGKLLMGMDSAESAVLIGMLLGDVNDSFNY